MNKKNIIITVIVLLVFSLVGFLYFSMNQDEKTSLTISQKKWIENNKNKVIDVSVLGNIPLINDDGNGVLFDFFDSLEKDMGLEFNEISYNKGADPSSEYSLKVMDSVGDNILFYQDNYAIVTKKKLYYNSVSEIKNLNIGVLASNQEKVKEYLNGTNNVTYTTFENENSMLDAVISGSVDGIVIPRLDYLDSILKNDLYIAYNIVEYSKNYVITLGSNNKLNKILIKYFDNFKKEDYEKSLNKHFADTYFKLNNIGEKDQTNFRSKRYSYGFILNAPYEVTVNGKLKGFDAQLISDFADMASVEIDFKRYSSTSNVLKDFNSNKLDIISSDVGVSKFDMDVYRTIPVYDNRVVIITRGDSSLTINNVSSLNGTSILTVKNSSIQNYLSKNDIKTKDYENTKELLNHLNGDKIAAVDGYVYDYYIRENKDIKRLGVLDFNTDHGFISRDIKDNKILNEFLDFYLSFINTKLIIDDSYNDLLSSNNNIKILQIILIILVIVLFGISLFLALKLFKRKNKYDVKLSKTDKLRYIDSLTSLKNRKYLNDNISKWDSSEVYPQAVIIIDLNNIAYINDNFGHKEGDKVIALGANILLNNQLSDSEILRTNGNEFLVFTIGHDEKTIVTYIRKLNKEFKELSHGFGAAVGYSMINDEIKTIDDAINEATIDMRNNKEQVN